MGNYSSTSTSTSELPVLQATKSGNLKEVEAVLAGGSVDVNEKDSDGWSPLHCASELGYVEIAALLVKKGGDVHAKDTYLKTPLHYGCTNGNVSMVELLLKNGGDISAKTSIGWTPLHIACSNGNVSVAELLLKNGGDVHAKDTYLKTPLHRGCENGNVSMVEFLLKNGGDCNAQSRDKSTPLHLASRWGYDSTVEVLLKKGACVTMKNLDGKTALEVASQKCAQVIIMYLASAVKIQRLFRGHAVRNTLDIQVKLHQLDTFMQERKIMGQWLENLGMKKFLDKFNSLECKSMADMMDPDLVNKDVLSQDVGMNGFQMNKFLKARSKLKNQPSSNDNFLAFISHSKQQAGVEARSIKSQLLLHFIEKETVIPSNAIFLDSDNLHDLAMLNNAVEKSLNFLLILSNDIFTRPWCLVELSVAFQKGINILPIQVPDSNFSFDYAVAERYLNNFEEGMKQCLLHDGKLSETAVNQKVQSCLNLIESHGISKSTVQDAIKRALQKIGQPLHLSSVPQGILTAELNEIVQKMQMLSLEL